MPWSFKGYFRKVKQDIQNHVLDLRGVQNVWVVFFVLLLDFLLQNTLLGLYIIYFLIDSFVNLQSYYVYFILLAVYLVVTLLINFVSLLSKRWTRGDQENQDHTAEKLLLALLSMFQAHYLWIALGPRFKSPMSYAYVAGM